MHHYDLIIVGGGLVGASLALALKDSGLSIALIDARSPNQPDPRLIALNATSCQFLGNLGIWEQLNSHATPIHQVHVSRKGHFGKVRLKCEDVNLPSLGHVIPAQYIEVALMRALKTANHLTYYAENRLHELTRENDQIHLIILNKQEQPIHLETTLIIGADGSDSTVRRALNIPVRTVEYQQCALVTRTQLQRPHEFIAYERFTPNGAIAMLPLKGHECATIWTAETKTIEQLMSLSEPAFQDILQDTFGYRLGRLQTIHSRFVYPLQMIQAEKKHVPGVLLVGNAAHTLHPIAAQGFNLALYEIAFIAEKILENIHIKQNIATIILDNLNPRADKQQIISTVLSHHLSQIFLSRSLIINTILQIGMVGFDFANPIKKIFIEKTLGKSRSISRLLLNMEK